jgi:ABC-type multidrug transport system fused ATPase/permease subunit
MQSLALTEHSRMSKGDFVYRLEADAPCLDNLVFGGLFPLVFSVLTLLVMFAVLLRISLPLALVSISIVPLIYVWIRFHMRRIGPYADETKHLEARMAARLYESFSAIRLVKSYARESFEHSRFAGASEKAMEASVRLIRRESIFSIVIGALTIFGNALVLLVGGIFVIRGHLSIGTLLVVIAYLAFVYGPLSAIAYTTGGIQRALASARRVRQTLELQREAPESAAERPLNKVHGEVRFENVTFEYEPGHAVVCDASFTARPGETVALVGPSGAGKSSLASLIPRFYEISGGRISIDGVDVREYSLTSLRENVAVVHQEVMLMSGSVLQNLQYGRLDATRSEIVAAAEAANAHEFISRLPSGYETELGEEGCGMSGGQKQRLSIARAFLKNAPILILDEPTAALDTISETLILDALKRLRAGRTTFVIAHRLSTIREADRILVMDKGRVVGSGTDRELLASCPLYRHLCSQLVEEELEQEPAHA